MSSILLRNKLNPLIYLLETHPNEDWDIMTLSMNPFITLEYILARPDIQWIWDFVIMNPNILPEYVLAHPEIFGDNLNNLSFNPNLTLEFVLAHPEINWDWNTLARNSSIVTPEYIQSHPEIDWNQSQSGMCHNPKLTPDFILSVVENVDGLSLSYNPNITLEYALAHPKINWRWYAISMNSGIFPEDIVNHKNINWDMKHFSANPNLTFDWVSKNQDIPWDTSWLSLNPNLALEDIKDIGNFDFYNVSNNPMNRVPAQRIIARTWRAHRKRKAEPIYLFQMSLKKIDWYLPQLIIRTIYNNL